ncbi:lipopolysaccharide biosynthesis protein [Luteimonas terrae]|uniref:Polysaccharide biosynthesis protein n=1 Tax=Luteimonas terrae TaxID=1530191 RepID=A0A4R5U9F2_9GAMM|nr:oligosaccharide flippase family protein [Luteimonas terrae]TDK30892.1 hypothetical protein E2F49_11170 [Luteimonas terrae]
MFNFKRINIEEMRGTGLFYAARLVPGLLNLALVVFLIDALPAADYGKFSTWFALCLGSAFFFFGWITQSVARHANAKDDLIGKAPEVFAVSAAISFCCMIIFYGAATTLFLPPAVSTSFVVLSFSIALHGVHSIVSATQQARFNYSRYILAEISRPLFALLMCMLSVFLFEADSEFAKSGYLSGQVIGVVALLVLFRREAAWLTSRIRQVPHLLPEVKEKALRIFSYGAPVSIWLAINSAWPAFERYLIELHSDSNEVGIYAAEYDIVFRAFVFALLPITLYSQPHIFRAYANADFDLVSRLIRRAITVQFVVGIVFSTVYLVTIFAVFRDYEVFSSMRFENVLLLCAAAMSWQIALSSHKWLECKKRVSAMLVIQIASLVFGALIATTLFNRFGTAAFAVGLTIAGTIYSFTCSSVGRRMRETQ